MDPTSEPRTPFDRSLVAYALASGAVASSASGAIVYSGVQDLSLSAGVGTANSLAIDVNGGGTDFTLNFLAHDGSNTGRLDIASSASSASLATGANKNIAAALSAGAAISASPASNQWGGTNAAKLMTEFDATTGAALAGDWGNVNSKYIGGRIETTPGSNQFNYGWIRISTPSSDAGAVTVHDWAYETTVGQSILAGQISAIPGGGAMALFSLGAAGLGRWRKRKQA
jgi:hypothetical protein